ncbi:MAG TPA: hypothetical protein VLA88_01615 [Candidatus Saccharimonadales bacterium]|nr:hypothetical protein [Candidatus Saccharimonadales bacterium]
MADSELLNWHIYEITTQNTEIHGVMLRGRIRKLGLEQGFNVLCENATDKEHCVRFAVLSSKDAENITDYLKSIISDLSVEWVAESVHNPVLSKLKVNKEERYTL